MRDYFSKTTYAEELHQRALEESRQIEHRNALERKFKECGEDVASMRRQYQLSTDDLKIVDELAAEAAARKKDEEDFLYGFSRATASNGYQY